MSPDIDDASPNFLDMFLTLNDALKNLCFVFDSESPKSLVPLQTFANFSTQQSCVLLTADGRPIQQRDVPDRTLQFTKLPNRHFVHSFVLAGVAHLILGVDFLKKYGFIIDLVQILISISDPRSQKINFLFFSLLTMMYTFLQTYYFYFPIY